MKDVLDGTEVTGPADAANKTRAAVLNSHKYHGPIDVSQLQSGL